VIACSEFSDRQPWGREGAYNVSEEEATAGGTEKIREAQWGPTMGSQRAGGESKGFMTRTRQVASLSLCLVPPTCSSTVALCYVNSFALPFPLLVTGVPLFRGIMGIWRA